MCLRIASNPEFEKVGFCDKSRRYDQVSITVSAKHMNRLRVAVTTETDLECHGLYLTVWQFEEPQLFSL